ncbi:MAG TPA: amidase [Rhizomicrobium sp.]|jgi:aspartyl-tRNA(Asn)/glutamyl-tRNA(Gln) amidotransferase subunit A
MAELWQWNAPRLSAAFGSGEVSPVEVASSLLARIATLDVRVNAYCLIDEPATLAQARASEERWKKKAPLSPLDGVPVAVKDILLTRGWPTLRGSRTVDPDQAWNDDAPVVARLREAGAVLLGKVTTPDHGWKGVTDSPLTGITRNPWNLGKTPGGSSGGSSAAVAARLAPLALGTDGGGSIRIPASFTGTFGLKPQFGRVPAWPLSPFGTVAHLGPMSRDVEGSAMLLDVMARPDARDWHSLPPPERGFTENLRGGVRGLRIAFSPAMGFANNVEPQVAELVARAAKRFADMGAIVEQADPPGGDPVEIFQTLWWGGAAYLFANAPVEKKALLDPGLAAAVEEGSKISMRDYIGANVARGVYAGAMRQFMEKYDLLLTPALAVTAFDAGKLAPSEGDTWMSWTPFSYPFNLTQQPAASVPCGRTREGLPVGLQIVGRSYDEWSVLRAASAYEAADPQMEDVPEGFA